MLERLIMTRFVVLDVLQTTSEPLVVVPDMFEGAVGQNVRFGFVMSFWFIPEMMKQFLLTKVTS